MTPITAEEAGEMAAMIRQILKVFEQEKTDPYMALLTLHGTILNIAMACDDPAVTAYVEFLSDQQLEQVSRVVAGGESTHAVRLS